MAIETVDDTGARPELTDAQRVKLLLFTLSEIEGQLNEIRLVMTEGVEEAHQRCVAIGAIEHCGAKAAAAAEYVGSKAFHGLKFWTLSPEAAYV